jgi:hypothetical protein
MVSGGRRSENEGASASCLIQPPRLFVRAIRPEHATGLTLGKSPMDNATVAVAVAAISVTRQGAQRSMPTMAEVEHFIDNRFVGS